MFNSQKNYYLFILIAFAVLVHHSWFFNLSPISYGDSGYSLTESVQELWIPSVWVSSDSLGSIIGMPNYYPVQLSISLADNFLNKIGLQDLSVQIIQRLFYFFLVVIFSSWFSYSLFFYLTKNPLASFVGSIVYNFNTFFLISASGQMLLTVAYTFFPMVLYSLMLLLEKREFKNAVFLSLLLLICGSYEFRATYVLLWMLFFYFIFDTWLNFKRKVLIKNTSLIFSSVFIFVSLSAFWLIGILNNYDQYQQGIALGRGIFRGPVTNNLILSSFTLDHLFWSGGKMIPFLINPIPIYMFFTPVLVFSTLFFYKKDLRYKNKIIFFLSLALVGIFLSKFYFPPLPGFYGWMYNHFPGFNAFREPSKFNVLIYLSYSALIAFFIDIYSKILSQT